MRASFRTGLVGGAIALALAIGFLAGSATKGGPAPAEAQGQSVGQVIAGAMQGAEVVDLTVLVSEQYPAHWPTHAPFQRWTFNWFKPIKGAYGDNIVQSVFPYYGQRMVIDDHTGTQTDCPAHFIPPPGSGVPFASEAGLTTCDKVNPAQWMGPAVVIDVRSILDKADKGKSPVITPKMVQDWEGRNGGLQRGDIVVFHSGYTDKYYKPFPEGDRLAFEPLVLKSQPGWPAPSPETMEYLNSKGVRHLAIDSPSMGYVEGGQPTHVAGLKYGMTWDEQVINVGRLPARGAFYVSLNAKIVDGSGGITRAVAIKNRGQRGIGE